MTENQLISWIFLSTALASQERPANCSEISMVADGINHSIPTEKEIMSSLNWLINKKLILEENKKYYLTQEGMIKYELATKETKILFKIWSNLEQYLITN
jgi:predicted transcriptional regulator